MEDLMRQEMLNELKEQLIQEEKSTVTTAKYIRDVRRFLAFAKGEELSKELVISYKQSLLERYAVTSANSMLAALNYFLRLIRRQDCVVKEFKVQRAAFRAKEKELTKEEYHRLLCVAKGRKNNRLYLEMQTICATGIRISELRFITVEALKTRRARVALKGKIRTVILPLELCRQLTRYAREKRIASGSIFVTRTGRPVDRSNILHDMKSLCGEAGVSRTKVFPHNLRHLFAVTYYQKEHDICHLADLLGHSNIDTTRLYTLVSCEEQERQIEQLELLYREGRKKVTA